LGVITAPLFNRTESWPFINSKLSSDSLPGTLSHPVLFKVFDQVSPVDEIFLTETLITHHTRVHQFVHGEPGTLEKLCSFIHGEERTLYGRLSGLDFQMKSSGLNPEPLSIGWRAKRGVRFHGSRWLPTCDNDTALNANHQELF
jgi:hypothetical protein